MQNSLGHPFLRPRRLNSYTAYSFAAFTTWGAILTIVAITQKHATSEKFLLIFAGWAIGWTSATIARVVYPPPKKRASAGPTSFFQGHRGA